MNRNLVKLALVMIAGIGMSAALAGDKYHVYKQSNGVCEADSRDHAQYDSARGSGWTCLGEFDYLSDAQNELERLKSAGTCN